MFAAVLAGAQPAPGQAPLRVRGAASLEAAATPLDGNVEIRGLLRDDAGRGIGNAHIEIELRSDQNGPPLRLSAAQNCPPSPAVHEARGFVDTPDEYVVDTDTSGAFCVRMSDVGSPGVLRLRFEDPNQLLDSAERWLPLHNLRRSLELRFAPEPALIPLERGMQSLSLETRLRPAVNGEPPLPISVQLRLVAGGKVMDLARMGLSAGERADFRIATADLGGPGPATLNASFSGSSAVQPAETSAVVLRTALVTLDAPAKLPAADPSDGVAFRVGLKSQTGGTPSGTIEARLGHETVGIGAVRQGGTDLVVVFEPRADGQHAELELRYLPDAPWWVPGPPQRVLVPIRPPSPWRQLPWFVAALLVGVWVIASWRRPIRTERERQEKAAARQARASIRLIERRDRGSGWSGRILDAHDGSEIAEADVVIRRRTFQGDGVVASTQSDEEGQFVLPPLDDTDDEGAVIEVAARWHSRHSAPLPAPGVLVLELVSRRRALLQRLVEWAAKRGSPWTASGEPTPGHVARTAEQESNSDIARWALETEEAAYGPNRPDAAAEERVTTHEPELEARPRERAH